MNAFGLTKNINLDEYENAFKNWINDIMEWLTGIFNNIKENKNSSLNEEESAHLDDGLLDIYDRNLVVKIKETALYDWKNGLLDKV